MRAGTTSLAGPAGRGRTRTTRKRGVSVALLGPDGSGKTTLARALAEDDRLSARRIYMGVNAAARDFSLPTTPWIERRKQSLREARPRTSLGRAGVTVGRVVMKGVGFVDRVVDRWVRYGMARHHVRRGRVVIFDRYALDPRVGPGTDTVRARVRSWLLDLGAPRPDLTIVLDAPVSVLRARKDEQSVERLEQLRTAYLALQQEHPGIQVIDAARDASDVFDCVLGMIQARREGGRPRV